MTEKMPKLYVRDLKTREVVHEVQLSSPNPRRAEKVLRGLLMRIDIERFYVDDSEVDEVRHD